MSTSLQSSSARCAAGAATTGAAGVPKPNGSFRAAGAGRTADAAGRAGWTGAAGRA